MMINLRAIYNKYYKGDLDYMTFKNICDDYNKECVRQIVEERKSLNLGYNIGSIKVIENERKFKKGKHNGNIYTSINHPASKKRKKEIIERGGTPLVMFKENGKIVGDNGGEEWLVYNTSDTVVKFYFRRFKDPVSDTYPLRYIKAFTFQPTMPNIRYLYRIKREKGIKYDL